MTRHEIGIVRTLPLAGTIAALFTPEYDENGNTAALEEIKRTNREVRNLASGLSNLTTVVKQLDKARIASDRMLAEGIERQEKNINLLKAALSAGISSVAKVSIQNQAGVSVARAEAAFLDSLSKQERITQEISVNPIAQKLMKYAMLCEDDESLCVDTSEDNVTFYVTSWLYGWKVDPPEAGSSGGYKLFSLFSKVTVFRRPSALSYLVPGDTFFYRYEVEGLMLGQGDNNVVCEGDVQTCAGEFTAQCRNSPGCYAFNDPSYYTPPTQQDPDGGTSKVYGFSSPFPSVSNPCLGAPPGVSTECNLCGRYPDGFKCCNPTNGYQSLPGMCIDDCENFGIGRSCDLTLDVIGARPSTIWLPQGLSLSGIRSMESLGWISQELLSPLLVGMINTSIYVEQGMFPYAADFIDPFFLGRALFDEREVQIGERLLELVSSANGQDNSAMALPGPMVEMEVAILEGTSVHVIRDARLFHASQAIITWATGGAPYVGWIPQDGCVEEDNGICCSSVVPGPIVSSVGFLQRELENITPEEYKARNLYESILTLESIFNTTNISLSFFNVSRRIEEINADNEKQHEVLDEVQNATREIIARSLERDKAIDEKISSLGASSGTWGVMTVIGLIWIGATCLCVLVLVLPPLFRWVGGASASARRDFPL